MKYRPDIDGLRAIAVLSVVIFHTFPKIISGGFIGVDIFFVISGYLITGIITSGLKANSFSFITFYSKRILRIFPALIVVLGVSLVLGWFFLLPDEYEQLGKHVAGGGVFISNFLFWHESGYFDTAAELKPLLHLWSLAIEEQFYILWPFLLWAAYKLRINFLFSIVILWAISFYCNIGVYRHDGVADFYSPQTRFWELLTGGALVVATHSLYKFPRLSERLNKSSIANLTSILGIGLIVAGLILIDKSSIFPGYWALLPVCGATLLIASGPQALFNKHILSSKILVWIGLISYPLYLWHWVLLVFLRLFSGNYPTLGAIGLDAPISVRILYLAVAFLLSWLTYRYIEIFIRYSSYQLLKIITLLLLLLLSIFGFIVFSNNGLENRLPTYLREISSWNNYVRVGICTLNYSQKDHSPNCYENNKKEIMLWGDSHAAALYPGLKSLQKDNKFSITQLTQAGCPPVFNVYKNKIVKRENCDEINEKILSISKIRKPDIILIHSAWILPDYEVKNYAVFKREVRNSVIRIANENKSSKIIIVGPFPRWQEPFVLQKLNDWRGFFSKESNIASKNPTLLYEADDILLEITRELKLKYISPINDLCKNGECINTINNPPYDLITYDGAHISKSGSEFFVKKISNILFK